MMKKILAAAALALLFVLNLSPVVLGEELQDIYEAYGLKKGDDELFGLFYRNPPEVIALRPFKVRWYDIEMPINVGTLVLEKGKDAKFSFAVKGEKTEGSTKVTVEIVSDITFRYAQNEDPRILFELDHNTHLKSYTDGKLIRDETSNKTGNAGGWGGQDEGVLNINMFLPKNSGAGNLGVVLFRVEGVQVKKGGLGILEIDTQASTTAGETEQALPAAIVLGVAGAAAAAVGAAAAGGSGGAAGASGGSSGDGPEDDEGGGSYKMVIYKDFGDSIRTGADAVFIQARMVEINAQGAEIERPDLTQKIEIFSPDNVLQVGIPSFTGTAVQTSLKAMHPSPQTAKVSFRFAGEGGVFQNNVEFKIIGESKIKLASSIFPILAASAESFELEYELVDFLMKPEVSLQYNKAVGLFELELGKNKLGKDVIVARPTEKAGKMSFQRFIHRYACEITAKNDKETAKEKFELHLCYEGIGTAFDQVKNNTTPDEIILECFADSEKEKREEKAYRLPLAVMRWNNAAKRLEPDTAAAEKLKLEFTADTKSKNLPAAEAVRAVEEAEIAAKLETGPSPVKIDHEKKPALYMLFPEKCAVAQAPEIEIIITVSMEDAEFEELILKGRLKPQNDYKAMIEWFINYGKGTFVHDYIKIGDVSIYHGALDFIENRVYSASTCPYTPKSKENHYEDGKMDVSRPNYIYLQDASMPHKIGEFKQIQSLHHELCHAIEHQHGDTGSSENSERHSYFIQHLTDVVKALADMERGMEDAASAAENAIMAFYEVFNDTHNAEPQTFDWFGVTYLTQHKIFERYADFDVYCRTNIPEERKQEIARVFRTRYFPGNLKGKRNYGASFKEKSGAFQNAVWNIKCSTTYIGLVKGVSVEHPDYKFRVRKVPQWVPGTLKIVAMYDVENIATGKTDTLMVELDGGSFDPSDYRYPVVDKFTVTWRATDKISDCIMGQPKSVSEAVKI
jgi:hypothetical protein